MLYEVITGTESQGRQVEADEEGDLQQFLILEKASVVPHPDVRLGGGAASYNFV